MSWCFAIINGRLAEIYLNKTKKEPIFLGHCYVEISDYKTKREQSWIAMDTAKFRFSYRNKEYKDLNNNKIFKLETDSE